MANAPITPKEKLAWEFAQRAHKSQVRKFTGQPYFDAHVQKVNGTLKLYTTDEATLIAALLHDVIEDCFENKWEGYAEIKEIFGKEIADIVLELTSDTDEIKHKWGGSKMDYLIYKMTHMIRLTKMSFKSIIRIITFSNVSNFIRYRVLQNVNIVSHYLYIK